MKNQSWAAVEINKVKKAAKSVRWGRVNKNTLIYSLAHQLAKAKRELSKVKKQLKNVVDFETN